MEILLIENIIVTISIVGISAFLGFIVGYKKLDEKLLDYWTNRK